MAHPLIGQCPVCHELLEVTRLHCRHCDTAIEGHFGLGRLYQLSEEQMAFLELFIRCEGRLNRVQDELDISYPTARNRLVDVIRTLGYPVNDGGVTEEERQAILQKVAAGQLSSEEAIKLLKAS
jgi:hypothetical protein